MFNQNSSFKLQTHPDTYRHTRSVDDTYRHTRSVDDKCFKTLVTVSVDQNIFNLKTSK